MRDLRLVWPSRAARWRKPAVVAVSVGLHALVLGLIGLPLGADILVDSATVIARTFAQLLEVPIIGVPSADAIAYGNIPEAGVACPIIDAKRGEVYTALYRPHDGSVERITEFMAIHPDELAKKLRDERYERVVFAGDAVKLYEGVLAEALGGRAVFAAEEAWWPRASDLASLALPLIIAGEFDELYKLAPIYVRLSQAEEMWEKRHRG
jgi:tRNA threonylcarbamoyladenosine biosynthesis protein TsaB